MSIIKTLADDGLSAAFKLIPWYYTVPAIGAALLGLYIWGKVWFHNKVEAAAQKDINAYIATAKKDAADLQEISTGVNTKIQIQYLDHTQVITKVVHDKVVVIQKVPEASDILSDGFINTYNSIIAGKAIDATVASDKTSSGVTVAEALGVENTNYGTCLLYKARADAWLNWYNEQHAAVVAENKKVSK